MTRKQKQHKQQKKSWSKIAVNTGLIFLCLHVFTTLSRLIFHLNPDGKAAGNVFDFLNMNIDNYLAMTISVSYAIMTITIIKFIALPFKRIWNFLIILAFGFMDALGVGLYYIILNDFRTYASIYFALYTLLIIAAFGLNQSYSGVKDENVGAIAELKQQIAEREDVLIKSKRSYNRDATLRLLNKELNELLK